ncbi:fascin-like [Ptychodera flava]|uniref:fascin-like n=1 Tax=Ptychodera flava TaxID=63121 RepID=UPI00396A91B0
MSSGKPMEFGFINSENKYLTQEKFGLKINAQGKALKARQKWTIEQPEEGGTYLRSHLGKYMSADKRGNVRCESDAHGADEKFTVEVKKDGRWAFRSTHGYYFGGKEDDLSCFSKTITDNELWTVHVGIHPQVQICNYRGRFARLLEDGLSVLETMPWGKEYIVTFDFNDGRYSFRACNDKYLHRGGNLVDGLSEDTQFILEVHGGKVAFKDCEGRFLAPAGPKAFLKAKSKAVGKDEVFTLQTSNPQGVFLAPSGKFVSLRQGQDLSANQPKSSFGELETFQVECVGDGKCAIRASLDTYWLLTPSCGLQATKTSPTVPEALFTFEYDENDIAIRANNGKYIMAKPQGHLFAISDNITEKESFKFMLTNRPVFVLRGEHGYVGVKSTNKMECNCAKFNPIHVTYKDGAYEVKIKGADEQLWTINEDGDPQVSSQAPDKPAAQYRFEFQPNCKICLRAQNNNLVKGEQSGIFRANGIKVEPNTLWEY